MNRLTAHLPSRRASARFAALALLSLAVASSCSSGGSASPLSIVNAAILGLVEGVTEYLPVSSTGHLLVTERLLDLGTGSDKAAFDAYTVVIQIGAILAVLGIFRGRIISMAHGMIGRSDDGRQALIAVVVAFLPFAIIGKLFNDTVKEHLLSPLPVAIAWLVGGAVILMFVAYEPLLTPTVESVSAITVRHAAIIGVAQTLALIPGTSRSLVTILAAMLIGISLEAAVEFSFLLGLITLSSATAFELLQNGSTLYDTFGIVTPLIGIAVACVAAVVSVRFMLDWLNHRGLAVFGWYRLAIGIVTIGLILADQI